MSWTRANTLLGTSSSTFSSAPIFVGNCQTISLSIQTLNAGASNITLRGSNADGFQAAIPDGSWSVLTVLPLPGAYLIEPGIRWMFAERASASTTTVLLSRFIRN